ncbi:MAG TPA: hypothetical protein VFN67_19220 [Polyangiales bacterium]|nr:hypothetical protein [Polyangiales bacterium]
MMLARPKNYGSFADFERDELRPMHKVGFSVDDLENEATFNPGHEETLQREPEELDFG